VRKPTADTTIVAPCWRSHCASLAEADGVVHSGQVQLGLRSHVRDHLGGGRAVRRRRRVGAVGVVLGQTGSGRRQVAGRLRGGDSVEADVDDADLRAGAVLTGLRRDQDAVTAGLTLPWSSGIVEGHVNRLKMLKRQMFGRAKPDLLRKRVLLAE
jgi:hypothetical protein